MALAQDIVLAILQGIAEIFPINPAAHAALLESAVAWSSPTPIFHMAVRAGALVGILAYFWQDIWSMATGVARVLKGKRDSDARLAGQILAAAIPALALGFLITRYLEFDSHGLAAIGWAMIVGAALLFVFDHMSMTVKRVEHATFLDAALIGVMQVFVLVPGVGRVVLAMTMARVLGYERASAARLSLLLGVPVLAALCIYDAFELGIQTIQVTNTDLMGGVLGMISGLLAAAVLMAWLRRSSFIPFVIYRLAVGGVLLAMAYGWIDL